MPSFTVLCGYMSNKIRDAGNRGLGRSEILRVRLNEAERRAFQDAASLAGLSVSAWARMALRERASASLRAAGKESGL